MSPLDRRKLANRRLIDVAVLIEPSVDLGAISKPTRAGELPQEGNGVGPGGRPFFRRERGRGSVLLSCKKQKEPPRTRPARTLPAVFLAEAP
jgi:hypothetical protein